MHTAVEGEGERRDEKAPVRNGSEEDDSEEDGGVPKRITGRYPGDPEDPTGEGVGGKGISLKRPRVGEWGKDDDGEETVNPKPEIRNLKSEARSPKFDTRTRRPKHETRNT